MSNLDTGGAIENCVRASLANRWGAARKSTSQPVSKMYQNLDMIQIVQAEKAKEQSHSWN
jgi:hypothetical protein